MADDERDGVRRRRRRKATRAQGAPEAAPDAAPGVTSAPPTATAAQRRRPLRDGGERGLRDIVGAGHSQVGLSGALRARDVNRPTDDDLAEAERTLVIVRRNWRPDDAAR
jgi:hypothetical protein